MFVPHNCVRRNERASCFLTPHIMLVLVMWARVQCPVCSRMHIHTRAYVTKKKPSVHARRHKCPIASSCPTAPVDIWPRLPMNLVASWPNPEPDTGPAMCAPAARRSACPAAFPEASYGRPGPNSDPARAGVGIASSTNTGPREQGSTKRRHGKSKVARSRRKAAATRGHACSSRLPAAHHEDSHSQGETEWHWFVSSMFRVLRHGACAS